MEIKIRDLRKKDKFVLDDLYLNGYAKKCGVYATAVYVSLCRHANKEQSSFPSLKKIAEEHNISIRQVSTVLKILESYNLIKRQRIGKKVNNRYFLIDKSEWNNVPISDRHNMPVTMEYGANHHRHNMPIHSKETHIKETHSKDIIHAEQGSAGKEANDLIDLFQKVNPNHSRLFANKSQRAAIERMVKKFGPEKVRNAIEYACRIFGKEFTPTITTPLELEKKLGNLIAYSKKSKEKESIVARI